MNSTIRIRQIKNLTNNNVILDVDEKASLEVSHYGPQSVTVELPGSPFPQGHLMSLIGEIQIGSEKNYFEAIVKVKSSKAVNDKIVSTEFHLNQIQKSLWQSFLKSKDSAQNHVDNLLAKLKGDK